MIESMNSRERAMAAFAHKKVDRVPIWHTDSNVWIIDDAGISFADMFAMEDVGVDLAVRGFEKLHTDMVTVGAGAWLGWVNAFGCPVDMSRKGAPIEVSACIDDPDTDVPKLDISKIRELIASSEICQKILKQTRLFKERVGSEKMIQFVTGGAFTLANVMAGTENFMVMLADEDENVKQLLKFTAAATAEMCNQLFDAGCDVIFYAEPNASGDMISQSMFEDIVVPATKDCISRMQSGKYLFMHICGQSTQRIPDVMKMGFNGLSVDAVVDLKAAMDFTGDKMSMMGNLSPSAVLLQGTVEENYNQSLDFCRYAGLEHGYFLGPGCDLPPKSPMENVDAMYRAACDVAEQSGN